MNNSRTHLIFIFVLLLFILLIAKLFDIQILQNEELKYYAKIQQYYSEKINAERGLIYDRHNELLVYNRNDISFYLDLSMASKSGKRKMIEKKIAEKFSSVFGKNKKYYFGLMNKKKGTVCIEEKVSSDKALMLKNFKADGFFYKEDPTRIYNYNHLASHLLGYVNSEYLGLTGVEGGFEKFLKGEDGTMLIERSAIGDMVTVAEEETKPAISGSNIMLTLNKSYQMILEEELNAGVKLFEASSGIGIIVDPNNGEILALTNIVDYDPNRYWDFNDEARRNKAITDTYEPGSTFKSFALAALFDQNLCTENEIINVENGRYRFKNVNISDTHPDDFLTVKGIFDQSSNIGITKLSQRLDKEIFYKYIRGFGFGNYTSTGLPGEVKGSLKKPNKWSSITKAFLSFGYEIAVTPIQLISAYSALINGGILYQPQIVKKEIADGKIIFENSPIQVRTVISKETSDKMKEYLVSVVENGTGKLAKLDFTTVGGKTGTSKKLVNGEYSDLEYNSSFVGFFPAENPKVVCLILLNSPKIGKYGGFVAAPIFKNVATRIIKTDLELFQSPINHSSQDYSEYTPQKNVSIKNQDNNEFAVKPVSNEMYNSVKSEMLKTDVMPNLTHMPMRDAILVLTRLGIKYNVKGSGKVISQSISEGEKIKKGLICKLVCKEITINGATIY